MLITWRAKNNAKKEEKKTKENFNFSIFDKLTYIECSFCFLQKRKIKMKQVFMNFLLNIINIRMLGILSFVVFEL